MPYNIGTISGAVILDTSDFKNKVKELPQEAENQFKKVAQTAVTYLSLRAISNFAAKAVKGYLIQEKAVESVRASLRNMGEEVNHNTKELEAFASEMQKITTYGDDTTLQAMSQGLNLGISNDQIKEATKAAMGLTKKLGVDLNNAMMMVGKASQGNTAMFSRYGYVIDESMSKSEKFAEVLKIGGNSFSLVTDEAKTTGGQIQQAMNNLGDSMDAIGKSIIEPFLPLINLVSSLAEKFNKLSPETQSLIVRTTGLFIAYKLLTANITGSMLAQIKQALSSKSSTVAQVAETTATTANTVAQHANTVARNANGLYLTGNTTKMVAHTTATTANTIAQNANTAAQATNAVVTQGVGSKFVGFLGRITGLTKGVTLLQRGSIALASKLGATGAVAIGTGTALAAVGTAFAGWEIGKKIAEILGIDKALENLYGNWFFGLDEAKKKSDELDKQIAENQKKRNERIKNQYAPAEILKFEQEYQLSLLPEEEKNKNTIKKLNEEIADLEIKKAEAKNSINSTDFKKFLDEELAKRKELADVTKKQKELEDERAQSIERANQKLASVRYEQKYNNANNAEKEQILTADIDKKRAELEKEVADKPEAEYTASQKEKLAEILELEAKRAALRKDSEADISAEDSRYLDSLNREQERRDDIATENALKDVENKDGKKGAISFMEAQYSKSFADVSQANQAYTQALEEAKKDNTISAEEKKDLDEKFATYAKLLEKKNRWEERLAGAKEQDTDSKKQIDTMGSFSAAMLNTMMDNTVQDKIAENTKKTAKAVEKIADNTKQNITELIYAD